MSIDRDAIHILHVNDEPGFAELVASYLQREDERFEIESTTTASDGLDRLDNTEFDCIVSDHDMPDQTGIEFLESVRDDYPDLPFILFTGKGSEEVASEAISAGVTDYLQKGSETDQYAVLTNRIKNAVERFRFNQALDKRNQELRRYKQMIDSMNEAACIYDSEGRFELVNEYLAEWYNTTPEELEGDQSALIPQFRDQVTGDPYQELLAGERDELRGELEGEFPTHGYAVLEYRLTPLRVDGAVEGVVSVARDISERKAREQELQRQNERLEEFASVVSHDLRSPLQIAEGNLELARDEYDSEHLDAVAEAHDRMETLIKDLLTLAREGDQVIDPEPVGLAELSENCWRNVETADATLRTPIDRNVRADRNRLTQLLENLIRNGVEHGGEDVVITVGELSDGFFIEDDGPGISKAKRDDVFDAGYSTAEDGTGFGLRIVKEVANAHGWEIRVTDGTNGGARFEITRVEFAD